MLASGRHWVQRATERKPTAKTRTFPRDVKEIVILYASVSLTNYNKNLEWAGIYLLNLPRKPCKELRFFGEVLYKIRCICNVMISRLNSRQDRFKKMPSGKDSWRGIVKYNLKCCIVLLLSEILYSPKCHKIFLAFHPGFLSLI